MAIDLKKKLGPLPVWAWGVLGAGGLGITYYLYERHLANSGTTATTTTPITSTPPLGGSDGGGGVSGGSPSVPTSPGPSVPTSVTTALQEIQQELANQSAGAPVDTATPVSPIAAFTQEATNFAAAQKALKALEGGGTTTATKGGSTVARTKQIPGLSIISQLQDLQHGLITKSALGPNAKKALDNAGGNINHAIANRRAKLTAGTTKPTRHVTTTNVGNAADRIGKKI